MTLIGFTLGLSPSKFYKLMNLIGEVEKKKTI
jgi:hypothetical protein